MTALPITDVELAERMTPKRRTPPRLRYLSFGAGVQSTCLYLMACEGAFGDDGPTVAIFADTQDEPASVYAHLDRLAADFGHVIPIRRVTKGRLSAVVGSGREGRRTAAPPLHVRNERGEQAMLRRQCTREFKIEPIEREARSMLGVEKGKRVRGWVESWQGISLDEAQRMKPNRRVWVRNRYPLVFDRPMTRQQCHAYNVRRGYPAPKSACVFCPFTDDGRWREMKRARPDEFAQAVAFDNALRRDGGPRGVSSESYVHRSLRPLEDVDFSNAEDMGQQNMFANECEGMCGV